MAGLGLIWPKSPVTYAPLASGRVLSATSTTYRQHSCPTCRNRRSSLWPNHKRKGSRRVVLQGTGRTGLQQHACAAVSAGTANDGVPESVPERSGQEGSSSSGQPSTSLSGDKNTTHNTSWATLLLNLPLEVAAAGARTNALWLKKRKRSRWWSREEFPKVPVDSLKDIEATLPEPVTLLQKLVPLALIFFCASFNLTILQNLKDALIVTTAGAETLPWLASCGVLPASLAFLSLYGRMVEHLQPTLVFYTAILPLVGFYALFATVLYPAAAYLHPHGMYANLAQHVPVGLHGLLKVVEHWLYSLFFCVGELWGGVVISVLFWSLANEVCTVSDAKLVYPLMGVAANVALVVAGNYMKIINRVFTQGSLLLSLRYLVGTVVVLTAVMMVAKRYVDIYICVPVQRKGGPPQKGGKKKRKGSLGDSLEVLRSSPMIRNLALLVMSYGISHRLFEFAWKGQLRALYPSAQAYQGILADVSIATGYATIALMLTGRFVFQFLGWKVAALATPAVMLLTGGAFFGLSLAATAGGSTLATGTFNLAAAGALAGAVTQVFARSSKFALFDPAKEMVYIEMTKEEKSKGKAAVDLVGSQIGKSGASWITQALLLAVGSISAAMPVIASVFAVVIVSWLLAVGNLGAQMAEHDKFQHLERSSSSARAETPTQAVVQAPAEALLETSHANVEAEPHLQHRPSQLSPQRWPGSIATWSNDEDDLKSGVSTQGQNGHAGNGILKHDSSPEPGSDNSSNMIAGQQLDGMGSQPLPNEI